MRLLLLLVLLFCTAPIEAKERLRVLVGCCVDQSPQALNSFLETLLAQDRENYTFDYDFADYSRDPEVTRCLAAFSPPGKERVTIRRFDLSDQLRIERISSMKDAMIERALEGGYDALFLVDATLLLHPRTVDQLLASEKKIISNIVWHADGNPQVWLTGQRTRYQIEVQEKVSKEEIAARKRAFLTKLREPGVHEVGGLGVCTLLRRDALEKGVSFRRIKNLLLLGEDCHFCVRAMCMGFSLFVDTHYPATLISEALS